jgi:Cu(I)-responsive transcriptional regulator
MNIGEASDATGVSAKMIRYYEEIGLIRPALRAQSGYRVYGESDIQTLRFVRRARDLGFTVAQIEGLLALWRDRSRASADVKRIATDHIAELQKKMRELAEMVATLEHLSHTCHGDDRPDCPILTSLGEGGSTDTDTARKSSSLGKGFEKKPDTRR